jgi:hypothetical protein
VIDHNRRALPGKVAHVAPPCPAVLLPLLHLPGPAGRPPAFDIDAVIGQPKQLRGGGRYLYFIDDTFNPWRR